MSPPSIRQPGDIVNEVYFEKIQCIIKLCSDVGDDPSSLIEEAQREVQVSILNLVFLINLIKKCHFSENGY